MSEIITAAKSSDVVLCSPFTTSRVRTARDFNDSRVERSSLIDKSDFMIIRAVFEHKDPSIVHCSRIRRRRNDTVVLEMENQEKRFYPSLGTLFGKFLVKRGGKNRVASPESCDESYAGFEPFLMQVKRDVESEATTGDDSQRSQSRGENYAERKRGEKKVKQTLKQEKQKEESEQHNLEVETRGKEGKRAFHHQSNSKRDCAIQLEERNLTQFHEDLENGTADDGIQRSGRDNQVESQTTNCANEKEEERNSTQKQISRADIDNRRKRNLRLQISKLKHVSVKFSDWDLQTSEHKVWERFDRGKLLEISGSTHFRNKAISSGSVETRKVRLFLSAPEMRESKQQVSNRFALYSSLIAESAAKVESSSKLRLRMSKSVTVERKNDRQTLHISATRGSERKDLVYSNDNWKVSKHFEIVGFNPETKVSESASKQLSFYASNVSIKPREITPIKEKVAQTQTISLIPPERTVKQSNYKITSAVVCNVVVPQNKSREYDHLKQLMPLESFLAAREARTRGECAVLERRTVDRHFSISSQFSDLMFDLLQDCVNTFDLSQYFYEDFIDQVESTLVQHNPELLKERSQLFSCENTPKSITETLIQSADMLLMTILQQLLFE